MDDLLDSMPSEPGKEKGLSGWEGIEEFNSPEDSLGDRASDRWILTPTGKVNLDNPSPKDVNLEDIVLALPRIPRFNGLTRFTYSIAAHTKLLVEQCWDPELKKWLLVHDLAEVYTGYEYRPFKSLFGATINYSENRFFDAICESFKLDPKECPVEQIQEYDSRALVTELKFLLPYCEEAYETNLEPFNLTEFEFRQYCGYRPISHGQWVKSEVIKMLLMDAIAENPVRTLSDSSEMGLMG